MKYLEALRQVRAENKMRIDRVREIKSIVKAFENSEDFDTSSISYFGMFISPKNKEMTMRDISIALDEILSKLNFYPESEYLDAYDLNMRFRTPVSNSQYSIYLRLKDSSKCKIITLSARTKIIETVDHTYAVECEA